MHPDARSPLLPSARLLRVLEDKALPMNAQEYQEAAAVLAHACRSSTLAELRKAYWRCTPGVEVLVENEYFSRTGELLLATEEEQVLQGAALTGLWARMRCPAS